jgi:putative IMPACT (imprinted ancient) family translation regulator
MEFHSYLTINAPAQGTFKEKGSKFLAFAYPLGSEEEIKSKSRL